MFVLFKEILAELPPSKRSFAQVILSLMFSHPFKIMVNIRMGQKFSRSRNPFLRLYSRFLKNRQMYKWSCDISYNAKIGKRVIFGHPLGIVIGNNAVVEDNVSIWQNVTLGSHGKGKSKKKYPTVRQGAKIFAGAIIIGGVTIGKDAIVGANSVVNIDVPDGCIAVGIPSKIINKK
jgi:serine O-acetyltransferase